MYNFHSFQNDIYILCDLLFFVLTLGKKGKYPCIANIIATPKINLSEVEKTFENGVTLNNEKKL
jgi:hypothetical protein